MRKKGLLIFFRFVQRAALINKACFQRKIRFFRYTIAIVMFLFCYPTLAETPTMKKLISDGVSFLLDKNFTAALEKFDQALLLNPNHAEATFRLGQTYIQMKNRKQGLELIQKSVRDNSLNVKYSLYLSSLYESFGETQKAQEEYQRIVDSGTQELGVKIAEKKLSLGFGRALAKKGDMKAALLIFNGLLLEYPDDSAVLFNLGNTYMALKRLKEAEQVFSTLFFRNPENVLVNMTLAKIYEQTNAFDRAQKHLKKILDLPVDNKLKIAAKEKHHVIESRKQMAAKNWLGALESLAVIASLNPNKEDTFFNMALAHLQLGEEALAEKNFAHALKLNPNAFGSRLNLGQLYYDTDRVALAKVQFQTIIDNDKSGRWGKQARIRMNFIHTKEADRALEKGDVAASLVAYGKASDFYAGNTKAAFFRGMILAEQKKYKEAQTEFESVVSLTPKNLRARLGLANVYEKLNMPSKEAEQYKAVMKISADSKEGKFAASKWKMARARGLWEDGRTVEAESVFDELTKEQPRNANAFRYLGILQASRGKLQKAASAYHRVLELQPANYAIKLRLGRVFEQLGMDSLAANEYRGVIFAGRRIRQVPTAVLRLAAVESRLSGFSNTLSYQFVYDDNLNLNDDSPTEEIRSDLALSFIYAKKTRDDLSFRVSWSPTYSAYHLGQNDFLRSVFTSNILFGTPDSNWTASLSRQDQNSLLNDIRLSEATSLSLGRAIKVFANPLLGLKPEGQEGQEEESIATSLNFNSSLRYIRSLSSTQIRSLTGNLSLSMGQSLRWGVSANLSYRLTVHRNLNKTPETRTGRGGVANENVQLRATTYDPRDYEYNGHTVSLSLSRTLAPGLWGSLSFSGGFSGYANLDSGAVIQENNTKRFNRTISLSPSLSYSFFRDLRFVFRATAQKNYSNLPVGFSARRLSDEDVIASFQSTSLGKYTRYSVEGGFVMTF